MKRYRPIHDNVLIKRIAGTEFSPRGLIYLGKKKQMEDILWNCEVLAAGPGITDTKGRLWPVTVKAGDKVVVSRNGIIAQIPDQKDQYICKLSAIAAKGAL